MGVDFTATIRATPSVQAYVLVGEVDDGCCGDPWLTWGVQPPPGTRRDEPQKPPRLTRNARVVALVVARKRERVRERAREREREPNDDDEPPSVLLRAQAAVRARRRARCANRLSSLGDISQKPTLWRVFF